MTRSQHSVNHATRDYSLDIARNAANIFGPAFLITASAHAIAVQSTNELFRTLIAVLGSLLAVVPGLLATVVTFREEGYNTPGGRITDGARPVALMLLLVLLGWHLLFLPSFFALEK